jgi:hypothetical protein
MRRQQGVEREAVACFGCHRLVRKEGNGGGLAAWFRVEQRESMGVWWRGRHVARFGRGASPRQAGGVLTASRPTAADARRWRGSIRAGEGRRVADAWDPAGSRREREEGGAWARGPTREKKRSGSSPYEQ